MGGLLGLGMGGRLVFGGVRLVGGFVCRGLLLLLGVGEGVGGVLVVATCALPSFGKMFFLLLGGSCPRSRVVGGVLCPGGGVLFLRIVLWRRHCCLVAGGACCLVGLRARLRRLVAF